jgi:hypothetical protein
MKMSKALRGNRDLPQLEAITFAAATAGTGTDFEFQIATVPNLRQGAASGTAGMQADNTMSVRWLVLNYMAAITGTATNYATMQLNQYRAGVVLTNTTSATAVSVAGSVVTITTAASGALNCYVGQYLNLTGGTGTAETIVVSAVVDATHITAYFANTHSGTYTLTSAPLATYSYVSGNNEVKLVNHQLAALPNTIKPGDVLTVSRVSTGTGLATPIGYAMIEWVEGGPQ